MSIRSEQRQQSHAIQPYAPVIVTAKQLKYALQRTIDGLVYYLEHYDEVMLPIYATIGRWLQSEPAARSLRLDMDWHRQVRRFETLSVGLNAPDEKLGLVMHFYCLRLKDAQRTFAA